MSLTLKTNPIRVLFVEDDEDYRETVRNELSDHGFAVRSFADGDSLLGSLDTAVDADVIVLDWDLRAKPQPWWRTTFWAAVSASFVCIRTVHFVESPFPAVDVL